MGEASRRKRQRRRDEGGGPASPGPADIQTKPTLQTFVLCERVETAQDGVQTIHRIFDRFNIRMEINAAPGTPIPNISIPMNYVLFARFGAGVGRFRASFRLVDPDSDEIGTTGDNWFWLASREPAHNIIITVSVPVSKSGPHRWIAYLDGEQVGEFILVVDLQRALGGPGAPGVRPS